MLKAMKWASRERESFEQPESERELAKLRAMLDGMPINVMLCDLDFRITYANRTSLETLRSLEAHLSIKADAVVGASIDVFHKNPAHQRGMLATAANLPHRARIRLGPETLDLLATAVMDSQGRYMGPMLTWTVVTKQVAEEARIARLLRMLDEMPINVMTANRDTLEIDYANRRTVETLKPLRHLLSGVDPEKLIGTSIDIFHKHPEHQRRMLQDPRNLPHHAKIRLGPETLDLRVSAIMDGDGHYVGPMVTWSVVTETVKMIEDFESNVKGVVDQVAAAATEMRATSEGLSAMASDSMAQASTVAAAAEEATTNVATVASAAEQMAASVAEIGRQVASSARIASEAVDEAARTNATVQGLAEASSRIGDVVRLISDIAGQTNLLALNATIEAARAGEAGKGFAVVASEVKSLANQTAKATGEIAAQIQAIQESTARAVDAIGGIGRTIGEINQISGAIAAAVEEQGAATAEISRNVTEAAAGTREVSGAIQKVSLSAGETGVGASQVSEAAAELSRQAEALAREVDGFMETVRRL
jgi:methyl-accepting chemotaxis protein